LNDPIDEGRGDRGDRGDINNISCKISSLYVPFCRPLPLIGGGTAAHRLHLPADDRRHYVAWGDNQKADFDAEYWRQFWGWLNAGGAANVVAYMRQLDLSHSSSAAAAGPV
jgi:hypothetical protein